MAVRRTSGGLDLAGENDHISPPGQAVKRGELAALQKADDKLAFGKLSHRALTRLRDSIRLIWGQRWLFSSQRNQEMLGCVATDAGGLHRWRRGRFRRTRTRSGTERSCSQRGRVADPKLLSGRYPSPRAPVMHHFTTGRAQGSVDDHFEALTLVLENPCVHHAPSAHQAYESCCRNSLGFAGTPFFLK
jgi:hypothetical protein